MSIQKAITEEIKNGVSWREVIKKYYSDNNPWLYKIITSEKRTRFIDQFIKPKKSFNFRYWSRLGTIFSTTSKR